MRYSKYIFLYFFIIASINYCSATIFLVHGSFAKNSTWYKPGGDFFQRIEAKYHGNIRPFSWSGSPLQSGIIEAAYDLAKEILETPANEAITLIGHSNGGNVIAYATSLIYFAVTPENDDDNASQRLLSLIDQAIDPENIIRSQQDLTDTVEYASIKTMLRDMYLTLYDIGQARLTRSEDYVIKHVYMMGTPIHKHTFIVNMNVTKHVFNLYSEADYVQVLVGNRTIPEHPRVTNLHTHLVSESGETVLPCHYTIHHEMVGKWVLKLPEVIDEHPEADEYNDGQVIFSSEYPPIYEPNK